MEKPITNSGLTLERQQTARKEEEGTCQQWMRSAEPAGHPLLQRALCLSSPPLGSFSPALPLPRACRVCSIACCTRMASTCYGAQVEHLLQNKSSQELDIQPTCAPSTKQNTFVYSHNYKLSQNWGSGELWDMQLSNPEQHMDKQGEGQKGWQSTRKHRQCMSMQTRKPTASWVVSAFVAFACCR